MEEKKIIGQECEFYDEGHCLCYSDESHYPHCLEYPNCYYKQLHSQQKKQTDGNKLEQAIRETFANMKCELPNNSQQKTFTLEEVKKIILKSKSQTIADYGDCGDITLINEFEDCLLAEFEREVE